MLLVSLPILAVDSHADHLLWIIDLWSHPSRLEDVFSWFPLRLGHAAVRHLYALGKEAPLESKT